MSSVEALTERVKQLEQELCECRLRLADSDNTQMKSKGARPKINVLSAEVVDSNPYRLLNAIFTSRSSSSRQFCRLGLVLMVEFCISKQSVSLLCVNFLCVVFETPLKKKDATNVLKLLSTYNTQLIKQSTKVCNCEICSIECAQ